MLLWNDLDHNGYFFHDLWFVDMDNRLQVRRQTRSCEIKRTTSTISSTTCGTDSSEHPNKYGNTQLRTMY